jgi:cytoskeletal protein CcmA (bactofilin family)
MFRRKDADPAKPETSTVLPSPPASRPTGEDKQQPELPRRQVDLPTAPATSAAAASAAERPALAPVAAAPSAETKRLIVGQGIRLSGEITACDRLVVEGTVEATLNETRALEIAGSGRFTGGCEVEEAEISGNYEGELTVRKRLMIRSTGRVKGTVRYGELEIERGGKLTGSVSMLDDKA